MVTQDTIIACCTFFTENILILPLEDNLQLRVSVRVHDVLSADCWAFLVSEKLSVFQGLMRTPIKRKIIVHYSDLQ